MVKATHSRLPVGVFWLLIYHAALVLVAAGLGYQIGGMMGLWGDLKTTLTPLDVAIFSGELLVLTGWGTAMVIASVGMMRRNARAIFLGMLCHGVLEIPAILAVLSFGATALLAFLSESNDERGWALLFLLFAIMWLPFALLSAWAFFYLRRLRN